MKKAVEMLVEASDPFNPRVLMAAPTSKTPFRVISLFCGCGGFDIGLLGGFVHLGRRRGTNGFRIVSAVDADPEACALYRLNVGPVVRSRVEDVRDWPEAEVVIGGPPCQPYSTAGRQRGCADGRDGVPAFASVVEAVRPRVFVMENVAGLAERRAFAETFAALRGRMERAGYTVAHRVLDAADFGVPQHRRRLFVVGALSGVAPFPEPTHGTPDRPHLTVRDAIGPLAIVGADRAFGRWSEGERRHPEFGASSRRLTADRPFPTIKASDTAANRLAHPWFDRYLIMPELLRAQSFPDDFIAPRRTPAIGNAVPPLLAWHWGRTLSRWLSGRGAAAKDQEHAQGE